jgi:hypothetical protein
MWGNILTHIGVHHTLYVREEEGCISGPAFGHKDVDQSPCTIPLLRQHGDSQTVNFFPPKTPPRHFQDVQ